MNNLSMSFLIFPPSSELHSIIYCGHVRATAPAIYALAFNEPAVRIETNIRRVFIHHFFQNESSIKDTEILPLIEKTLKTSTPRRWYYALMDYGAVLKREGQNPTRRSAHYQKQAPFEDSNRQIQGMILKALIMKSNFSEREIVRWLKMNPERVRRNLIPLQKEGFIEKRGNRFTRAEN